MVVLAGIRQTEELIISSWGAGFVEQQGRAVSG